MPLINGQKMACEPCIRGHRSTKCTHANERLMVPVRKPGRPLSSCPHPSSRACSCAAVTAAIPRKQKCHCGPSLPALSDGSNDDEALPSPSKTAATAAAAAFRVQKQGPRANPTRKPSVDLAGLGRMDASQLNILPSYSGIPRAVPVSNGQMAPMSDMSVYGAGLALTPADSCFSPESSTMLPMFSYPVQPSQPPAITSSSTKLAADGHHGPSTNGSMTVGPTPKMGGCCGAGAGANGGQAGAAPRQMSTPAPAANGAPGEQKANGFCSTTAGSPEAGPPPVAAIAPPHNGVMMAPFQAPLAMQNGIYPYFPQPTIFNYPPQFGSFLQPLQPEQWKQFMATMSFAQPVAPCSFDMAASGSFGASGASGASGSASWTSHQCSCGDSCQCVGCAAHPYNEATQDYVRSAWNTMVEDGQKPGAEANGATKVANNDKPNGSRDHRSTNEATTPVTSQTEGTVSPAAPQTPSDGTSGLGEEQTLSANDFFFVSYPFGESCAGDTASCPCGDDCQCIGCVIHNNPGNAEETTPA